MNLGIKSDIRRQLGSSALSAALVLMRFKATQLAGTLKAEVMFTMIHDLH